LPDGTCDIHPADAGAHLRAKVVTAVAQ